MWHACGMLGEKYVNEIHGEVMNMIIRLQFMYIYKLAVALS